MYYSSSVLVCFDDHYQFLLITNHAYIVSYTTYKL